MLRHLGDWTSSQLCMQDDASRCVSEGAPDSRGPQQSRMRWTPDQVKRRDGRGSGVETRSVSTAVRLGWHDGSSEFVRECHVHGVQAVGSCSRPGSRALGRRRGDPRGHAVRADHGGDRDQDDADRRLRWGLAGRCHSDRGGNGHRSHAAPRVPQRPVSAPRVPTTARSASESAHNCPVALTDVEPDEPGGAGVEVRPGPGVREDAERGRGVAAGQRRRGELGVRLAVVQQLGEVADRRVVAEQEQRVGTRRAGRAPGRARCPVPRRRAPGRTSPPSTSPRPRPPPPRSAGSGWRPRRARAPGRRPARPATGPRRPRRRGRRRSARARRPWARRPPPGSDA